MKTDKDFLKHSNADSDPTSGFIDWGGRDAKWWADSYRIAKRAYRKFWLLRGLETKGRFDPDAIHKVSLRRMIEENKVNTTPEELERLKLWSKSTVSLRGGAVKYKNGTAED